MQSLLYTSIDIFGSQGYMFVVVLHTNILFQVWLKLIGSRQLASTIELHMFCILYSSLSHLSTKG